VKLYFSPGACSLSPHIALREAGMAFEPVRISTRTHTLADGSDFYAINPKGYVPVLELDDGTRITEGAVIVGYIADHAPDSGLAPAHGTMARVRVDEWMTFITSELHKGFSPLFNAAMPDEAKALARARLGERFAWVESQLEGKTHLTGDHFTIADAYLFTVARWGRLVAVDLSGFPRLLGLLERIGARPAVQDAMRAEGILK
jgi:glutathione S-transferase